MKKIICIVITIGLMLSGIPIFAGMTESDPNFVPRENKDLEVKFQYGFADGNRNYFKIASTAPAVITVTNSGEDFKGEIQIDVVTGDGNYIIYAIEADLPKGVEKQFHGSIPLDTFTTRLNVRIMKENKDVFAKSYLIGTPSEYNNLTVGFLADNYDSVKYLAKSLNFDINNNLNVDTVRFTENNFPENSEELDTFNVLIINNFDTTKLSDKQYIALKDWVQNGGMVLMGTGANAKKTLGIFTDSFVQGEIQGMTTVDRGVLSNYAKTEGTESPQGVIADLNITDDVKLLTQGEKTILSRLDKSFGTINICAFDFADDFFASWSQKDDFLSQLALEGAPRTLVTQIASGFEGKANNVLYGALNNIPEMSTPTTGYIAWLLGAYIIIVGPMAYIILKKKGKRELMWIAVPAVSFVFTAIIYANGMGTRLNEPIANMINVIHMNEGDYINSKTYAAIFNPKNKSLTVEGSEGVDINYAEGTYDRYRNSSNSGKYVVDAKITLSPVKKISFYNNRALEKRMVTLSKPWGETEDRKGSLKSKLVHKDDRLVGTITNSSQIDIEEATVISHGKYFNVGDIKAGETATIGVEGKEYYGNIQNVTEGIVSELRDYYDNKSLTGEEIVRMKILQQRESILRGLFQNELSDQHSQLIGWGKGLYADPVYVNGKKVKSYERIVVTASITADYIDNGFVDIPYGTLIPTVDTGNFNGDMYNNSEDDFSGYGAGEILVTYQIPNNIEVESLSFREMDPSGNLSNTDVEQRLIYNHISGAFEDADLNEIKYSAEETAKYVDSTGKVIIKYIVNGNSFAIAKIKVRGIIR